MTKSELTAQLAKRFPQLLAEDADVTVNTILEMDIEAIYRKVNTSQRTFWQIHTKIPIFVIFELAKT
jgi:nucleoid DNA-binding protein